jgi:hypothetical protein
MNERKEISKEETVSIQQRKEPSREEITHLAYGLYLQRFCEPGKDVEDWLRAEKELSTVGVAGSVKTKAALVGHA